MTYWLLAVLAVWRITYLLHAEDGPWGSARRLREAAGSGFAGELLDCFYCLSVWVALPFAAGLAESAGVFLLAWPALSGGAIMAERLTSERELVHVPYTEEES